MKQRYTANLYFKKNNSIRSYANDLDKLIQQTLLTIDYYRGYVKGTIKDNRTGKIVHKCKKFYE